MSSFPGDTCGIRPLVEDYPPGAASFYHACHFEEASDYCHLAFRNQIVLMKFFKGKPDFKESSKN